MTGAGGVLAALAMGLSAVACSSDASNSVETTAVAAATSQSTVNPSPGVVPTTTSESTTTTEPSTTTTESAHPIVYGDMTLVSGTVIDLRPDPGDITFESDGRYHGRNGHLGGTVTSNDSRVAGTIDGSWNSDRWGTIINGAFVQWGSEVITNDKGSWERTYTGVYTTKTGDLINGWFVGKGQYQGLTFYMSQSGPTNWVGLIFTGEPPAP